MRAKLEYLGEWAGGDVLDASHGDAREMSTGDLMEIVRKGPAMDIRLIVSGHMAILGSELDEGTYSLEIRLPLVAEECAELDLPRLDRTMSALRQIQTMGYFLEGQTPGHIICYKTGPLAGLEEELERVGEVLSQIEPAC